MNKQYHFIYEKFQIYKNRKINAYPKRKYYRGRNPYYMFKVNK